MSPGKRCGLGPSDLEAGRNAAPSAVLGCPFCGHEFAIRYDRPSGDGWVVGGACCGEVFEVEVEVPEFAR